MKAAIYCRNAEMFGFLQEYAQNLGYEFVIPYIEDLPSNNSNRPIFKKMRMDARQNKFHAIITLTLKNFSDESLSNIIGYINDLEKYDIELITFEDDIKLLLPGLEWEATRQRRLAGNPIKSDIARRKALGTYKGGRPKKND